jgi:hypothetical protein
MSGHEAAALAGALLTSLTLMGLSRKVFGKDVVARRLVPHRADIGVAAFFTIGLAACVELGLVDATWAPGGHNHLMAAALSQMGYLASLLARGDLPPTHPHRLALLVVVWSGLASGGAQVQIVLETASLWIVKLRLAPDDPIYNAPSQARPVRSLVCSLVAVVAALVVAVVLQAESASDLLPYTSPVTGVSLPPMAVFRAATKVRQASTNPPGSAAASHDACDGMVCAPTVVAAVGRGGQARNVAQAAARPNHVTDLGLPDHPSYGRLRTAARGRRDGQAHACRRWPG